MKKEDLVVGAIYVQDYIEGDREFIFKYQERKSTGIGYGDYISRGSKSLYLDDGRANNGSNQKIHIATPEEKRWLLACVKAGKFIDLKDLKIESNFTYKVVL